MKSKNDQGVNSFIHSADLLHTNHVSGIVLDDKDAMENKDSLPSNSQVNRIFQYSAINMCFNRGKYSIVGDRKFFLLFNVFVMGRGN